MRYRQGTALIIFLLSTLSVSAQERELPLNTDRPGQSINPFTAGEKALLVQAGYGFTGESEISTQLHTGDFQLRYGIFDRLEISFTGLFGYLDQEQGEGMEDISEFSWNRLEINSRVNLYEGDGAVPAVGVELGLAGIGFEDDFPDDVDFRAILTLVSRLSEKMSLTFNLAHLDRDQIYGTFNFGFALADRWSVFGEHVQFFDSEELLDSFFNLGGGFLVNETFQLDLTGGILTVGDRLDAGEQFYLQVGLSKVFGL